MGEEAKDKKEEAKQAAKPEVKPEESVKAKPEPPAAEKKAKNEAPKPKAAEGAREKKGKKISRMKLSEVEQKLKVVQEKMGGFQSGFAHHLLARKKQLTQS